MSRAEWELIEMARARAMADRLEREAVSRAAAAGLTQIASRHAYALGWLAMHAADRIVRLEQAREQAYDEGVSNGKGMARIEDAHAAAAVDITRVGDHEPRYLDADAALTSRAASPATPVPNPPSVAGPTPRASRK